MTSILRFSEAANLALHACAALASRNGSEPIPSDRIASALGVSPSHLGKVLQRLVRGGILKSLRGSSGGFALAVDPGDVTLLAILECVDGTVASGGCLLGRPVCGRKRCALSSLGARVGALVRDELGGLTLGAFVARQRSMRKKGD